MQNERDRILELLASGAISAEEAARLLDCISEGGAQAQKPQGVTIPDAEKARLQGKKLRVEVTGDAEEAKNINVNVSIPLVLARFADNIIANCIPKSVNEELKSQGVDLRSLNIGAIVDTFETLDEDIVNVDVVQEETDIKVRVYVE